MKSFLYLQEEKKDKEVKKEKEKKDEGKKIKKDKNKKSKHAKTTEIVIPPSKFIFQYYVIECPIVFCTQLTCLVIDFKFLNLDSLLCLCFC